MIMKVENDKKLEDGMHFGKITGLTRKEEPFAYIQFEITTKEIKKTVGFPAFLSPESKLGLFLSELGQTIVPNTEINIENVIGTEVQFQTITKKATDGRSYSNIIRESVKKVKIRLK